MAPHSADGRGARARPLRIVHGSPFYWPAVGGGEGQVKSISERLARRGHQVTVITQKHTGVTEGPAAALPARETVNGVAIRRVAVRAWPEELLHRFTRLPGCWRLLTRWLGDPQLRGLLEGPLVPALRWHAERARPDVVMYSNYYFPGMAYGLLGSAAARRWPRVGIPLLHIEETWSGSPITRDLLRRSTALLANTPYEARYIESIGVPGARVHPLGAGVEPALLRARRGAAIRAAHGIGREPVVGCIGRLSPTKGTVTLIEAMRHVWRTAPAARLILAGRRFPPGSEGDQPVEEALAALPPAERQRVICIEGFPDADKSSLYDALDVFAMPSTSESFGIAFLEAWMCDRPVVGARIGAVECVVDHGVDGLLATPGDARETADAIRSLLTDPDRRARFAAAGRAKTEAKFTWERLTDVVEGVYATLAGRAVTGATG